MKARLILGGFCFLSVCIALLLAACAVFVLYPPAADRAADLLGSERLSFLVQILYG